MNCKRQDNCVNANSDKCPDCRTLWATGRWYKNYRPKKEVSEMEAYTAYQIGVNYFQVDDNINSLLSIRLVYDESQPKEPCKICHVIDCAHYKAIEKYLEIKAKPSDCSEHCAYVAAVLGQNEELRSEVEKLREENKAWQNSYEGSCKRISELISGKESQIEINGVRISFTNEAIKKIGHILGINKEIIS